MQTGTESGAASALFSYRIAKYRYLDAEDRLRSSESDWTSFTDVGEKVSIDDYIAVESKYLSTLQMVCEALNVDRLQVVELEDAEGASGLQGGEWLELQRIEAVARSVLREEWWCKLRGGELEVHFGYDFYMYIVASVDISEHLNKWADAGLFIQEFRSPYI
jgi:hypothetical protein